MITHLYIKNFTLIDELDIQLHEGFSVITGETGAGKSIILGAIGLLLGQRADSKTIKQGAEKCVVEAHFNLARYGMEAFFDDNDIEYDADDCIVRRELLASGKSRAFVNDTPVSLALLKELGERLMDVHSQHQNLLLNKHDFQLSVIDIIAKSEQQLASYKTAYEQWHATEQELSELKERIERDRQNNDFLQFQYDELSNANLKEGEQEELEQRSETMSHSEEIKSALYEADQQLSADETGVVESLRTSLSALRGIERVLPSAAELAERMESAYIDLKDLAGDIGTQLERIDFDPAELDTINNRLDRLYELEKKYHADHVEELIEKREELHQQLTGIENADSLVADLEQKLDRELAACRKEASALTKLRTTAAAAIEKELRQRLEPLGMPHVRFKVEISAAPLSPSGCDSVAFLFSANTSSPLQPVSQVASGGEIARVMLALKALISGAVKLPTIIFDEIDTGVSGKIAEQMAKIMAEMGRQERQVISITHLPQIAALGTSHYKVYKEETAHGTASHMVELSTEERITEIAQMLSGSAVSEAAVQNARELLGVKN